MNITDELLSQAAPEAAERWLSTLPGREDCEHEFSLTFQAAMEPLLSRRRRRWKSLVLLAAVVAALGTLLVSAGAERRENYYVYADQQDGCVTYVVRPREDALEQEPHRLYMSWIPEGFVPDMVSTSSTPSGFLTRYVHRTDEERWIYLYQFYREETGGLLFGDYAVENLRVGGEEALLLSESGSGLLQLVWSSGFNCYSLSCSGLEKKDVLRIAENLKW
ncbi:MAG: DUF4367 domain-containing protein [Oscillibacter sp.]|nr:DUF4367 domain-containing protein [Oscillibacter sp.]